MVSRILLTCVLWIGGASMASVLTGQTFTNSLILLCCCGVVACLWCPLLWRKPRPRPSARVIALLVIAVNLFLVVWTCFQLPEARRFQSHFNYQQRQATDPSVEEAPARSTDNEEDPDP